MAETHDSVILLHTPQGNAAAMARVYPDFPSRTSACAYLARVDRPQDYHVSCVVYRKPVYLRGDRFLAQFAPKHRRRADGFR